MSDIACPRCGEVYWRLDEVVSLADDRGTTGEFGFVMNHPTQVFAVIAGNEVPGGALHITDRRVLYRCANPTCGFPQHAAASVIAAKGVLDDKG